MSTTRPPMKPKAYFVWGFAAAAVLSLLIGILVYFFNFSGSVPAAEHSRLQNEKKAVDITVQQLAEENQGLRKAKRTAETKLTDLRKKMRITESELDQYLKKEQQVEFIASRQQMDIKTLAKSLNAIEGLSVRVLNNGILISGIASPYRLGSSRLQDDSLIPKLSDIARVFNEQNAEGENPFYAAAIGNTDSTPVMEWSGHGSNLWLGAKRARSLANMMKDSGFPDKQVFLISWGSIQASSNYHDPDSRKAEIFIVPKKVFEESVVKASRGPQTSATAPAL
ncbi:MAG: hypothetical protein AAF558_03325 [Verrucomicrobiota bacterium]